MADEQTLNHIMNEYEELRISAANERKKRIEEVNKKIPRVAEIDREIFQCGMENTKRIFIIIGRNSVYFQQITLFIF